LVASWSIGGEAGRSHIGDMKLPPTSILTICGLEELGHHKTRGVSHVLSILDPEWPEPEAFGTYDPHHRTTLRFHDAIEPGPDLMLPQPEDVEAILEFGRSLTAEAIAPETAHLLVHCHMGVSRSTAAMAMLMAQSNSAESEERIFGQLLELRPQAWPNSLMVEFADNQLGRRGRLITALGSLYAQQLAERPQMMEHFMRTPGRRREIEMARQA
jgi:predicted protein tyrosine phosphatase